MLETSVPIELLVLKFDFGVEKTQLVFLVPAIQLSLASSLILVIDVSFNKIKSPKRLLLLVLTRYLNILLAFCLLLSLGFHFGRLL